MLTLPKVIRYSVFLTLRQFFVTRVNPQQLAQQLRTYNMTLKTELHF